MALEAQHPHAINALAGEEIAIAPGRGAEILADDHGLVAPGFQGDKAEQVLLRESDIGALQRAASLRDQPQPAHAHDVIDAQPAGMAQAGAQGLDEGREAVLRQAARRQRRQRPVLAFGGIIIRRRANRQAGQEVAGARPAMAAVGIRAYGEIGDQPDFHAGIAAGFLRRAEGFFRQPLQENLEIDLFRLFLSESGDFGAFRIAQGAWPVAPAPDLLFAPDFLLQDFENGVVAQQRRGLFAKVLECAIASRFAEKREQAAQKLQPNRRRGRPVHLRQGGEPRHFNRKPGGFDRLRDQRRREGGQGIGVQRIIEQPGRGRIGAETARIGAEQGMGRADRQSIGAEAGGGAAQSRHPGEIADSAIVGAAQGIDLRRQAKARPAFEIGEGYAAFGRRRDSDVALRQMDDMVAGLVEGRQQQGVGKNLQRRHETAFAAFQSDGDFGRAWGAGQADGFANAGGDQGRAGLRAMLQQGEGSIYVRFGFGGEGESGQDFTQGFRRDGALLARLIGPERRDAGLLRQLPQVFIAHARFHFRAPRGRRRMS